MEKLTDNPHLQVGDIVRVRQMYIGRFGFPKCEPYKSFGNGPFLVTAVHAVPGREQNDFDMRPIRGSPEMIFEGFGEIAFERDDFLTAVHRRNNRHNERRNK